MVTPKLPPPSVDSLLNRCLEHEASLIENVDFHEPNIHRSSVAYLNHGAMGDPYQSTLTLRQFYTDLCYQQPMVFHRSLIPPLVQRSRDAACDYLGLSPKVRGGFAFASVTTALFGVLQGVHFDPGDLIVTSDVLYHSLVDTLHYFVASKKIKWIQVETPPGAKLDEIYQAFETTLMSNTKIKLVIVDHVSSKPSIVFPIPKICALCRSRSVPILVDGAHVPGTMPSQHLALEEWGATFYAVTFHKWCNTPRGESGGLWVNTQDVEDKYIDFIDISELVVHGGWIDSPIGAEKNKLQLYLDHTSKPGIFTNDLTQGIYDESTREYENILVLPHCIQLVQQFETEFQQHVHAMRLFTRQHLQKVWKLPDEMATMWYGDEEPTMVDCWTPFLPMLSIPLPMESLLAATQFSSPSHSLGHKLKLLKKHLVPRLWEEHTVEVPMFVWRNELLGVRVSFSCHVTPSMIEELGQALLKIMDSGISL